MDLLKMDMSKMLLLCVAVLVMSQGSVEGRVHGGEQLRLRRNAEENVSKYALSGEADYADDQSEKDNDEYMGTDDNVRDDDDDANDTDADNGLPVGIKSVGQTFRVKQGDSVWLNCEVVNAAAAVIIWNKNSNYVLYHGNFKTAPETNIKKFENQTLLIGNVSESDAANYSCNVLATKEDTPAVNYIVEVMTPAEIVQTLPSDNDRRIPEGKPVEIVCQTKGFPEPKLIWSKNGTQINTDNTVDIEIRKDSLYIAQAKKEHAGTYQCLADNKVAKPAHSNVTIQVLYAPTVHIHQEVVNGDEGVEIELFCIIHGEPGSIVSWLKDGQPISEEDINLKISEPALESKTHHRKQKSLLHIASVKSTDFGRYTCQASNEQGHHARSIMLVQQPVIVAATTNSQDEPKLRWTVHSRQPILRTIMQFRKVDEMNSSAPPNENEWKTVDVNQKTLKKGVYLISNNLIVTGGRYEARVLVENTHGRSDYASYYFDGEPETSNKYTAKNNEEPETGNEYRAANNEVNSAGDTSKANRKIATTILSTVIMCVLVRLA